MYRFNDFDPPIPFLTGDASTLHSIISEIDRVYRLHPEAIRERQASYLYKLMQHFSKASFRFSERLEGDLSQYSENSSLSELLNLLAPADKFHFQKYTKVNKVPKHHLPTHWAVTSGSTGVPLKVQCTAITKAIGMGLVPWTHLASSTDFSWRLASVKPTNPATSETSQSWDPASSLLYNVGPMLSISSSEDILSQLSKLEKFQPNALIVFPSVLKEYVSLWSRGVRQPLKLNLIRTMGETLSDSTRDLAQELTDAIVLDTYSSSEVGRIATQIFPNGPYIVNNYSLIVEILRGDGGRCLPGETGRVVVTDLFNYATPLIRYDIGDWAMPYDTHHHKLRAVKGRTRNVITLPNGKKIWPLVGYREFSEVVPVRQFHIKQVSLDSLEASFYVDEVPSKFERERVDEIIRNHLSYNFTISSTYQTVPLVKKSNGKLEDFVSLVT